MKIDKGFVLSFVAPFMILLSVIGLILREDTKKIFYLPIGIMGISIIFEKHIRRKLVRKNILKILKEEGYIKDYYIEKTGNKISNIPDGHICCGSAGTYNILQSEIAKKLLKQKIENIDKVKPDFISTGNIGCIMQIANGTNIPILHTVELIDLYTGGPKPKSLGSI